MTYEVSEGSASWAQSGSTTVNSSILKIEATNNENTTVYLTSLTVQLGTGYTGSGTAGTVMGSDNSYHSGSGESTTATLSWTGGSTTASVNQRADSLHRGTDDSDTGYFENIGGNRDYNVTFYFNIELSPQEAIVFNIYNRGKANTIITSRKAESQSVSGTISRPLSGTVSVSDAETTVLYGESVNLDDVSLNLSYSGVIANVPDENRTVRRTYSVTNPFTVYSRQSVTVTVTVTASGYTGSVTGRGTITVNCKLNKPSVTLSSSTGGFTIGTSISPSSSVGNNPSGLTYNWQVSINNGNWTSTSIPYTVNSGNSIKFRLYLSKSGYESSDYSSDSRNVAIYYEPRSMSSNGFTYEFWYTPPNGTAEDLPTGQDEVAVPTGSLSASWSSFQASKNLGRFNYYRLYVFDQNGDVQLFFHEGSNNPSTSLTSGLIEIQPTWAGRTCYLKLVALCKWPDPDGTEYGPQETATFISESFFIGGYPEIPEVKYPSNTSFYSANQRLRVIFSVTNPDYFDFEDITNVTVEVSQPGVFMNSFSYTTSKSMFFSKLEDSSKPSTIENGTVVDFTVPESITLSSGSRIRVRCSNQYLTGDWTEYFIITKFYSDSIYPYMTKSRKLLQTDLDLLMESCKNITQGYSNYDSSLSTVLSAKYPEKTEDESYYKVMGDPYLGNQGIIYLLVSLYNLVSEDSVPPEENFIDLSKINTEESGQKVEASSPPFSGDPDFIPYGNYFNYIISIFKNML